MQATFEQARVGSEQFDPEKRKRDDTETWLAETLSGSMRTMFEYRFDGRELYASDGSALEPIFDDAIEQARNLPSYELRRRRIEKQEYSEMLKMMRNEQGNTMVVISDFPPELMQANENVGGYNVTRKQTMLRVLTKTQEGTLKMYSQSLDQSNRRALEAIYEYFGARPQSGELLGQRIRVNIGAYEQELLISQLMNVYDRSLQAQFGGEWHAGQVSNGSINTYDFVRAQSDLLEAYFYYGGDGSNSRLTRELAASMKLRFEGRGNRLPVTHGSSNAQQYEFIRQEMFGAGIVADNEGTRFDGCGMSSRTPGKDNARGQLENLGFGNQADKPSSEKLIWKKGVCRIDNCPTRPGKTDVAQCSVCRGCQHWFDRGRDPSKIYRVLKRVQKESVTVQFGNKKETKIKK